MAESVRWSTPGRQGAAQSQGDEARAGQRRLPTAHLPSTRLPGGKGRTKLEHVVCGLDAAAVQLGNRVHVERQRGRVAVLGGLGDLLSARLGDRVAVQVDLEAALLGHQLREVLGEAVGVVEHKGVLARNDGARGRQRLVGVCLELADAALERAAELDLLLLQHRLDALGVLPELGEGVAHVGHDHVDEAREEARRRVELLVRVADGAAQDAAQHVAAGVLVGRAAVRHGERERADVVRQDAVGHVDTVGVLGANLARVGARAGALLDGLEQVGEQVRVVVGHLALQHRRQALQAHAGVDRLRRQALRTSGGKGRGRAREPVNCAAARRPNPQRARAGFTSYLERAVRLAVKLHEHQVPDLEDVRVVLVDQLRHLAAADAVVVDLGARPARAGVAHLPKVLLHAERQDAVRRQAHADPDVAGLRVDRQAELLVAAKVRHVQAVLVQAVDVGQQVPRHGDGLLLWTRMARRGGHTRPQGSMLATPRPRPPRPSGRRLAHLEVVAKGPVAEHLKERVVVQVLADIVQVVVLAAGADAGNRNDNARPPQPAPPTSALAGCASWPSPPLGGPAGRRLRRQHPHAPGRRGNVPLLRVGGALELAKLGVRVDGALEDGLELVHAGVGEEQRGVIVGDGAAGGHERVAVLLAEVVDEGGAHAAGGPRGGGRRLGHGCGLHRLHLAGVVDTTLVLQDSSKRGQPFGRRSTACGVCQWVLLAAGGVGGRPRGRLGQAAYPEAATARCPPTRRRRGRGEKKCYHARGAPYAPPYPTPYVAIPAQTLGRPRQESHPKP